MKTKITTIALAAALGLAGAASGQVSINNTSFSFFDDFTGFDGNADPTNWTTANVASTSSWEGTGTGTGTAGGKYSFGDTGSGATFEGSLGFLPSSTRAINAIISFTNDTGSTLTDFSVSYVAEHWRSASGGRNNGWAVFYEIDGGTPFALTDLTYVAPNNIATGGGPHGSEALSQSFATNLAAGETISFTFFGDNGTGGGSRQGVAIDDFSFTAAVPEPSAYALLAGLVGLGYVMVRRRRA